jgi:paraquat-inducible protein B
VTDPPAAPNLPPAPRRVTFWPNLIWAMPVAALLIVVYLVIQWLAERGEVVTVTFDKAGGARAGETKVMYQGVEAGHVIAIKGNPDGRRLDIVLRLRPEAKAGLNTNARFYLIGASPSLDLSSLRAVVTGVAIGYAPGQGGTPEDHFIGLDRPPSVLPGDRGTQYVLIARTLGSIREGSVLLFRGQAIGKVSDVQLTTEGRFRIEVFVFQPYDMLIKSGDRFAKTSPFRLSFADGGINVNLAPSAAILTGGIELDASLSEPGATQSPPDTVFTLYASANAARQGLSGPTVRYALAFDAAAGDLEEGSPVTLLGFQVGEVEHVHLAYDQRSGKPYTSVSALLYPQQLDPGARPPAGPPGPPAGAAAGGGAGQDWQAVSDAKLRRLIRLGFRARLEQSPPLVGARAIALVPVAGAPAAGLISDGTQTLIPSDSSSADFAGIAAQAHELLAKLNSVPIEAIGANVRTVTGRLKDFASSPQTTEGLAHLASSLAEIDGMLKQVQPQIGPLVQKLNQAAGQIEAMATSAHELLGGSGAGSDDGLTEAVRQLNEAARSVRSLADYLERHPESLIRGKQGKP